MISKTRIQMILFLLIIISFCTKQVDIFIKAEDQLNNGGNPVVLRIYQLSTDINFRNETSESFWRKDAFSSQGDIIGRPKEIILHPGEILRLKNIKIEKNAAFLGIVADFYKPDNDQWSYIFDLAKNNINKLLIVAGTNSLSVRKFAD